MLHLFLIEYFSKANLLFNYPGNSFYGYTIMNKAKHVAVDFVTEDKALKMVNDPRFMSLEEFPGDCFEVSVLMLNRLN